MNTVGPVYPAHIAVNQALVRLVADETGNAGAEAIASDQKRVATAQAVEATEANGSTSVDFVT